MAVKTVSKKRSWSNCGIQVNLRRRTESKGTQASLPHKHGDNRSSQKISGKHSSEIRSETISAHLDKSCLQNGVVVGPMKKEPGKHHGRTARGTQTTVNAFRESVKLKEFNEFDFRLKHFDRDKHAAKFDHLLHRERSPNGGAVIIHAYQNEISILSPNDLSNFVDEYFQAVFGETTPGVSECAMGIVHASAAYMPDYLEYFSSNHPNMTVKAGVLGKSDIETLSMAKFQEQMYKSYQHGTYRSGPLMQVSLVGTVHEEVGDFFPEFLDILEENPFLKAVMPWGDRSAMKMASRSQSNDGPILWARPGEQMVPTADLPKSPLKRKRCVEMCWVVKWISKFMIITIVMH